MYRACMHVCVCVCVCGRFYRPRLVLDVTSYPKQYYRGTLSYVAPSPEIVPDKLNTQVTVRSMATRRNQMDGEFKPI